MDEYSYRSIEKSYPNPFDGNKNIEYNDPRKSYMENREVPSKFKVIDDGEFTDQSGTDYNNSGYDDFTRTQQPVYHTLPMQEPPNNPYNHMMKDQVMLNA